MSLLNPVMAPIAFMLETPVIFLLVQGDRGKCPSISGLRSSHGPYHFICSAHSHYTDLLAAPHTEANPTPSQGLVTEPLCPPDLQDTFVPQSLSCFKSFIYISIVRSTPIVTRGGCEDEIIKQVWKSFKSYKQDPSVNPSFSIATFERTLCPQNKM